MKSSKNDPKVKKTLIRNYEQKVKDVAVIHKNGVQNEYIKQPQPEKTLLNEPSACSSELFYNYIGEVKNASPPPVTVEDIRNSNLNTKITKKLNFHFNDRMYKNLVELNTNIDEVKNRREKSRPLSSTNRTKKDLEPNIKDFYQDIEEPDSVPNIPIIKPKFKSIQPMDNGYLHNLVASFENL